MTAAHGREGKLLEIHQELPGRMHLVLIPQRADFRDRQPSKGITMSPTNRRSFLARSAALAAVPTVAALAGGVLAGRASAATLPGHAPVLPSGLPLTNSHLTEREKANLAVVLQAYHDGEGASLNPQGFMNLFAADGVLNGIGDVDGQASLRGAQLSGLIVFLAQFLPDIHRELKKIT
ncbi:MAG TPA: hypothetical protein VI365_06930, partial [Trebonia sp.]